jgi:hypothetical protein
MQINFNPDHPSVARVNGPMTKPAPASADSAPISFDQSEALNQALAQTPDTRSEVVTRARNLVASDQYPPDFVLHRIARLLATSEIQTPVPSAS